MFFLCIRKFVRLDVDCDYVCMVLLICVYKYGFRIEYWLISCDISMFWVKLLISFGVVYVPILNKWVFLISVLDTI